MDSARAGEIHRNFLAEDMGGTNVTRVKSALQMQGHDCGPARPPSAWPLTATQQDRLRDFMIQNKLIGA
ncbi:hypothetical protein [Devosia sp. Root436]|uniref:hypothetical protein n=1 Tax=Devosia sp. Root436 TaxID=1736537 RepID=UPI000AD58A6D|nr:hypothetical protein [Devosia sp. Root436]